MDDVNPKLLKIVALAKRGIGGEKESAIALVRRICEREGINFDDLMSERNENQEYAPLIKLRSRDELQIIIQVAARFATTKEWPGVRGGYSPYSKSGRIRYTCTPSRHIDTLNAISVYLKAYRVEKKKTLAALNEAFYSRHSLFSQFNEDEEEQARPERTLEEQQQTWRAAHLMETMTETVSLHKEVGSGE